MNKNPYHPNLDANGYDIIGDVHGHCDELKELLTKMNYRHDGESYFHPEGRIAIFGGDLIDRGPQIRETLKLVKAMHDRGKALMTVGNHEYNAVGYCTMREDDPKVRVRELSTAALKQYQATVDDFEMSSADEWQITYIEWFRSLPLYLDTGKFRVVHACWSQRHIDLVGERTLADYDFLDQTAQRGTKEYHAVETILKGAEIKLPDGCFYHDKDGFRRDQIRVKWWIDLPNETYRSLSLPEQEHAPEIEVIPPTIEEEWDVYPRDDVPVFVGHYWLPPIDVPEIFGNVVCLDYSVGKGGNLVACSIGPEANMDETEFTVIPSRDK